MKKTSLNVTVAVVTYNAEAHIGRCIETIQALDYSSDAIEILVVDGCSEDSTQLIVRNYMKTDSRIRLIENSGRTISSNRNKALQEAVYPYIAFTDSDCEVPEDWLNILVEAFQRQKSKDQMLVAVGGGNIPPAGQCSKFLDALGIMLDTFMGSLGSVQGKIYPKARYVDSLACLNVLYDKDIVLQHQGFDLDMKNIGEDAEMHFRLRQAGYKLLYVPQSSVFHKLRSTPWKWVKNMFEYGKGRVVMFRKHHELITFRYLLPLLFIAVFCFVPFYPMQTFFLLPLTYFPAIFLYSLVLAFRGRKPVIFAWIAAGFILTHWGYALGMIWQLVSGRKTM